jgi:hypothetical protein
MLKFVLTAASWLSSSKIPTLSAGDYGLSPLNVALGDALNIARISARKFC